MPELWEYWCDSDNQVLLQLTQGERLRIATEIDGLPPMTKCMQRAHLVKEILESRRQKETVYISCRREDGGCDFWATREEFIPLKAEEIGRNEFGVKCRKCEGVKLTRI